VYTYLIIKNNQYIIINQIKKRSDQSKE